MIKTCNINQLGRDELVDDIGENWLTIWKK